MWLVRGPALSLVVMIAACASHAKLLAQSATQGVKAQVAELDPAIAWTVGDQVARGAVNGALTELASDEQRQRIGAFVGSSSSAAARGIMVALHPDAEGFQQLVDHAVSSAIEGAGRRLAADSPLRTQLAATTHELSASAVTGARDALLEIFPACTRAWDRRACVEGEIGEMARTTARQMMGGFIDASRWPILAIVFLAGVLVTLAIVLAFRRAAARTHAPGRHRHRRA